MGRQCANVHGLDAVLIHQAGHFHAAALRQVVDQAVVGDVAVDHAGLPVSWLWMISEPYSWLRLTSNRTPRSPTLRACASQPAICTSQRRMYSSSGILKSFDQVGAVALDKPGHVFAEMLAAIR